jgi:hypothetical protein
LACARTPLLPPRREPPERPLDRLLLERLLLPPLLDRPAPRLLLRPPRREEPERLADFRRPPLLVRDEEPRADDLRADDLRADDLRDDDPPRFRADFRPRFEPPDRRDELLLPDFLRDPRLEVAITRFPVKEEVIGGA